ncbi:Zinc finger protein [Komagataella phaffii CBS 7435]|uniref:Zn(2)-C6 fungal-type domain-containing protein n=2 Tax=Komagataella phaffii TaxID=460519 RepID=C4R438_KOMPG|nr:Hypothetical protein PAS_chr3_0284 [Komagataella phaffii GS115]AOA63355.1 GQ67_03339T0 [Komagataella phaffii]CAH2449932.1 Zinc finger protein [Komagataella phaffii CBS 7435]AOA68550.1 GQ68_03308T0 [Komagataella phaffii GS115]CAY70324.1 Hypothetical protein PAS_chr3_0284 [Komagataella phaffii GS115]CCA39884.1 Zinc finger protein [Komagataella phaffii CBS 7435]
MSKEAIRISKACEGCRRRKVKCTGGNVCDSCKRWNDICRYREFSRPSKERKKRRKIDPEVKLKKPEEENGVLNLQLPGLLSANSAEFFQNKYFGPASNFSFVTHLNQYLQAAGLQDGNNGIDRFGMQLVTLRNFEHVDIESELAKLSYHQAYSLLEFYFETWHIPYPIFDPELMFGKFKDVWLYLKGDKKSSIVNKYDKAVIYLLMSIGGVVSCFDSNSLAPHIPLARILFEMARREVPNIQLDISYEAVKVLYLFSLSSANFGDTSISYLYSGSAVRSAFILGLHKNALSLDNQFQGKGKKQEMYERHRIWVATWVWEKYWSFCMGRPSCIKDDIPIPHPIPEVYTSAGYTSSKLFPINLPHMKLRVYFTHFCTKIQASLYNTSDEFPTVFKLVESISQKLDEIYPESNENRLCFSDNSLAQNLSDQEWREWFWIRAYYLYLKMLSYRPILVFSAYLKLRTNCIPKDLRIQLDEGSEKCFAIALQFAEFLIESNRYKKHMRLPIFFIATYVESACTVLLFYIVSNYNYISPEQVSKVWDTLHKTCAFLEGVSGPYIESSRLIANDAIKSLQTVLLSRQNQAEPYKIPVPPAGLSDDIMINRMKKLHGESVDSSNCIQLDTPINEEDFESFWQDTINWLSST